MDIALRDRRLKRRVCGGVAIGLEGFLDEAIDFDPGVLVDEHAGAVRVDEGVVRAFLGFNHRARGVERRGLAGGVDFFAGLDLAVADGLGQVDLAGRAFLFAKLPLGIRTGSRSYHRREDEKKEAGQLCIHGRLNFGFTRVRPLGEILLVYIPDKTRV